MGREDMLRADSAPAPVGPVDRSAPFEGRPPEIFAPGRVLLWAGEPAETVFRIVTGFVRLERYLPDGSRIVASFAGVADTVGLCAPDVYRFTAVALTRVLVQRATRRSLVAAAQTPEARADLVDRLAAESCALSEELLVLLHERAEQRLAHFLLHFAERLYSPLPAEPIVRLPMSRADIADHLGLTVETVCRALSRMRAQGAVTVPEPSTIVIRRPRLLRALCRESPIESAGVER